jgi:hypothetical protein
MQRFQSFPVRMGWKCSSVAEIDELGTKGYWLPRQTGESLSLSTGPAKEPCNLDSHQ